MKKSMLKVVTLTMMMFLGTSVFAQGFSIHIGAAFPQSGLSESRNSNADNCVLTGSGRYGYAGTGLNAGLQWQFGTKVNDLAVVLNIDGFYNGPSSDMKDYYEDQEDNALNSNDDYKLYKARYINGSAMLGLNYKYKLNENMRVYGEAALGINARFITNSGYAREQGSYTQIVKNHYKPAFTFAYQVGAGIMLNNKYSVGVHYFSLGTSRVTGETRQEWSGNGSGRQKDNFKYNKLSSGEIALRLGIHF